MDLMKKLGIFLLFSLNLFIHIAKADQWAVLVTGSNTYANYRHSSDIFHAYQILVQNGVLPSKIIVMNYNDTAFDLQNPFPGQVFNKPRDIGINVYKDIKIDYTGDDVIAANFIAVITGDSKTVEGEPVLMSGAEDTVFINLVGHGGDDFFCFPSGPYLYSSQLLDAFQLMQQKKMFGQLVIYIESCESGSMLTQLSLNQSIYGVTASGPTQSSYGTYCPPDDIVNGQEMNTCLGDVFSVNWMQNCDKVDLLAGNLIESLQKQFENVQKETTQSAVTQYSDISFVFEPVGTFLGDDFEQKSHEKTQQHSHVYSNSNSYVRSFDIPLHLLYFRYLRASSTQEHAQALLNLRNQLAYQERVDLFFYKMLHYFYQHFPNKFYLFSKTNTSIISFLDTLYTVNISPPSFFSSRCDSCCIHSHESYRKLFGFDDYSLKYARVFSLLCSNDIPLHSIIDYLQENSLQSMESSNKNLFFD